MADFFWGYVWPTIIIVLECLAVTVPLLLTAMPDGSPSDKHYISVRCCF